MKILWVSPEGAGKVTAESLKSQGHGIVAWGSGAGTLDVPLIQQSALTAFATVADLVVVDGPFPLVRTNRSWRPCTQSLFFDELRRKHAIRALGPTPTVDLLCADVRYFKKWLKRLAIPYVDHKPADTAWISSGWFHGSAVTPTGPYLEPWKPLFKSVGFRGHFAVAGIGESLTACDARWNSVLVPEGREAEFLVSLYD